jgi:hypothetical protein
VSTFRQQARDRIGAYFGGTFDPVNRCWRDATGAGTPTYIALVGTLRTHFTKQYPLSDHTYGMPKGSRSGGHVIVHLGRTDEHAITTGPLTRYKRLAYDVTLHLFMLSGAAHAEDAQDDVDTTVDSIADLIRADRTLGSGANGVFTDVGEDAQGLVVDWGEPATKGQRTTSYVAVHFTAVSYVLA